MKRRIRNYLSVMALSVCSGTAAWGQVPAFLNCQIKPAMGWNSWDCFGAGVNQQQTLANADYMEQHLKSHGWNIITVDIQWYEPHAHSDQYKAGAPLEMDQNGRLLPAGNRFPLTMASHSFKPLADALHARGLKFGLHLMRGIPRQAVVQNVPILGTRFHAADIANQQDTCRWNTDMFGVDMSKPGAQEYYDSVFALMASWDLDLVKVDDLSTPYHTDEIEAIRKAIDRCGRPITLSTSPGPTPVKMGEHIASHANMWRISDDFWDNWHALDEQFARLDHWTPYRGGGHFPDADMLPLGTIRTWNAKEHHTHFTHDEQLTMITLWSIARSPLILGANLPENDAFTLSLLTNDEVIGVDQNSENNRQLFHRDNAVAWVADVPGSADKYLALFNTGTPDAGPQKVSVTLEELGFQGECSIRDLWSHQDLGKTKSTVVVDVVGHGARLLKITRGVGARPTSNKS